MKQKLLIRLLILTRELVMMKVSNVPLPLLSTLLSNLSLRCSCVADHLSARHLCYADPDVDICLSILFNLCLFHGVIHVNCIASVIIPIVEDKNMDSQDVNNYGPILLLRQPFPNYLNALFCTR